MFVTLRSTIIVLMFTPLGPLRCLFSLMVSTRYGDPQTNFDGRLTGVVGVDRYCWLPQPTCMRPNPFEYD